MRLVFTSDPNFPPLLPCITNWLEAVEDATRRFGSCPALRDKINCDASGRKRPQILVEETDPAFLHGFSPLEKKQEKKEAYVPPSQQQPFFLFYPSVLFMQSARRRRQHWVSKEHCHWFLGIPSIRLSMYTYVAPVLDRPWEGKRGKRVLDGLPHFSYALQVVGCPRHQARLILARPKRT